MQIGIYYEKSLIIFRKEFCDFSLKGQRKQYSEKPERPSLIPKPSLGNDGLISHHLKTEVDPTSERLCYVTHVETLTQDTDQRFTAPITKQRFSNKTDNFLNN